MGYNTRFEGKFSFNRELSHREWVELTKLGNSYDIELYKQYTETPETLPDSYLQWIPNEEGTAIVWNGGEKFHDYIHWLRWLAKHYLKPHGLSVSGRMEWRGEEIDDMGIIYASNNRVTHHKLKVEGVVTCPECNHKFISHD